MKKRIINKYQHHLVNMISCSPNDSYDYRVLKKETKIKFSYSQNGPIKSRSI